MFTATTCATLARYVYAVNMPPYHHGDLPAALVRAARELLRENPTHEPSLREVARAAGVSHAAPYRHFATSAALRDQVGIQLLDELADTLSAAVTSAKDPEDALRALAHAYLRHMLSSPAEVKLIFEHRPGEPPSAEVMAAADRTYGVLMEAIVSGQRAGAFVAGDPVDLANTHWALMQGVISLYTLGKLTATTVDDVIELIDPYTDLLLTGLRPRDS